MRRLFSFLRLNLSLLLVLSFLANIGLGVLGLVLQPMWKAAAVTSAIAATKATALAQEKSAVAKARSKEKAKARLKRVATAVPVAGLAAAGYFEYAEYLEWLEENPTGTFNQYSTEVVEASKLVADDVLADLPDIPGVDAESLMDRLEAALARANTLIK